MDKIKKEIRSNLNLVIIEMTDEYVMVCNKFDDSKSFWVVRKLENGDYSIKNSENNDKFEYSFPQAVITKLESRITKDHEKDFLEKVNPIIEKLKDNFKRFFERYNDIEEEHTWDEYFINNIDECIEILKEKKDDLLKIKYPK